MEKYYVFDRNYNHIEFYSYQALLGFLGSRQYYYYSNREYEDYSEYDYYYYYIDRKQYYYYDVYDEEFNLLSTAKLRLDISDYRYKDYWPYHRGGWLSVRYEKNYLGFRNGPVPGTGNRRRFYGAYRNPKTTQELRSNQGNNKYIRGRRKKNTLPNAWDDVARSNFKTKSWKNNKVRKQWQKNI
jgi:hypothetical protein